MVDNRSAGFYGVGGAFNFKSGDPSGSAAKMSQEKYGSEAMYLPPVEKEGDKNSLYNQPFVDRSALLNATLNSLAMSNVASVLNANKHKKTIDEILSEQEEEIEEKDENEEDEEYSGDSENRDDSDKEEKQNNS